GPRNGPQLRPFGGETGGDRLSGGKVVGIVRSQKGPAERGVLRDRVAGGYSLEAVEDAAAAAENSFGGYRLCNAQARPELPGPPLLHRAAGERRRSHRNQVAAALRNEAGQAIVALLPRGDGVVAQAHVDREPRADAPVVLN